MLQLAYEFGLSRVKMVLLRNMREHWASTCINKLENRPPDVFSDLWKVTL